MDSSDYYPNVKQEVFRIFTPNKNITEPIDELFASERKLGKLIIGVHIRKGDYKNYMGGKYYFDDSVFMRYMDSVKSFKPNCVFSSPQMKVYLPYLRSSIPYCLIL